MLIEFSNWMIGCDVSGFPKLNKRAALPLRRAALNIINGSGQAGLSKLAQWLRVQQDEAATKLMVYAVANAVGGSGGYT